MTDEELVKELIAVVVEKRKLEKRESDLKLQVLSYIQEKGKYENDLATVSPIEHQERKQFDRILLARNLENDLGLTGARLEIFLESCNKRVDIMPSVKVQVKTKKD